MTHKKSKIQGSRWHNQDYPDNVLKAGYMEWKYFNFITPEYSGIFVYSIADPLNITGDGGARVLGRVFTAEGVSGGSEKNRMQDANLSSYASDFVMGPNSIEVHDGNVYQIKGKTKDLEWDLRFAPASNGIKSFADMGIIPLNLEKASWFIEMPKSTVRGAIKVNGESIDIDGTGYSDSNWGAPIPLLATFNWAQCNANDVSLVVGEIQNFEIGKRKIGHWGEVYVLHYDELISFGKNDFSIEHLKWEVIPGSKIKVPTVTLVAGENKEHKISLLMKVEASDPFYFRMPLPVPIRPVIVEQVASFYGGIHKKEGSKLRLLHKIDARGFKEYTLRDTALSKIGRAGIYVK